MAIAFEGGSMRFIVFYRQISLQFCSRPTSPGAELPTFASYIIQYTQSDTVEARLDGTA